MRDQRPSATAWRVAQRRAAHQLLDVPLVFEDPLALRILGPRGAATVQAESPRGGSVITRAMRAYLAARSRFAEDQLAAAVARGVSQYVVLGAGLDTFAYRNPYPPGKLRVFEVDFPATQTWKRQHLAAAGIPIPDSLTFVPVNFETQNLSEQLVREDFDPTRRAFFSWLGVTMYLTRDVVMETLGLLPKWLPPGSGIVFDFSAPLARFSLLPRLIFWMMARRVAGVGEPWRSKFVPAVLAADLRALGYQHVELLGPADIDARYFKGRKDKLRVGVVGNLALAQT